jgi:DNA polymerase-3 subunit gamma/tau
MATTEIHKIPDTILSRCQRFDFRRIPTRVILQHLQKICEQDAVPFEQDALWVIARQGDGSMRDAQSLLDQTINFTNANLKLDLVVSTLGLTDRALILELLTAILNRSTSGVVDGLKKLHESGSDGKLFLLDFMQQVRNALVLRLSPESASTIVDLPDSERDALIKLGAGRTPEDLHLLFDMCLKGAQDLNRASDPSLVLEMILLRMSHAPAVGSFRSAGPGVASGAAASSTNARAAAPASPAAAPSAESAPPVTSAPPIAHAPLSQTGPVDHRYKELVEKIKEVNGLIGAQLENCFVLRLEQKWITLGVAPKHKFLFDKINQPDFKRKVGNYINTFWGPGYSLTVVLSEPGTTTDADGPSMSPKVLQEKIEDERQIDVRKAVEAHPLVQSAQTVFKAEIRSIKEDLT